jgi:hypothetical protein
MMKRFLVWAALCLAAFALANVPTRTATGTRFRDQVEIAPNVFRSGGKLLTTETRTRGWPLPFSLQQREADEPGAPHRLVHTRFSLVALALDLVFFAALFYLLASLVFVRRLEAYSWRQVLAWCACLAVLFGIGLLDRAAFIGP